MNNPTIRQPCIFIISGGRTATRFLSELLAVAIDDCFSVQEPDVLRIDRMLEFSRVSSFLREKINDFGLYHITAGKLLPLGNVRGLSLARQKGSIGVEEAASRLFHLRQRFITKHPCAVYAECNLQMTGLVDVIPYVFPVSKTAFIIRDGRDWVRSYMNEVPQYGKTDPLYYFSATRPTAEMFPSDPFRTHWKKLSQFKKLCWLWQFHIRYALKTLECNSNSRLFKYEDLFQVANGGKGIRDLLNFLTRFPDGSSVEYRYDGQLDGKKFHQSRNSNFPKWNDWSEAQVRGFHEICGGLMAELDYGKESEWLDAVSRSVTSCPGERKV